MLFPINNERRSLAKAQNEIKKLENVLKVLIQEESKPLKKTAFVVAKKIHEAEELRPLPAGQPQSSSGSIVENL